MKKAKSKCVIFLMSIILFGAAYATDSYEGKYNKESINKNQGTKRKQKLKHYPQESTRKVNNCLGSLCP